MSEQATERPAAPPWTLGWRLKRALSFAEVSAEEMADELGVHRGTISRWMNDREEVRRAYLRVWALRCGVPLEWLQHGDETWAARDSNPEPMDSQPPAVSTADLKAEYLRDIQSLAERHANKHPGRNGRPRSSTVGAA